MNRHFNEVLSKISTYENERKEKLSSFVIKSKAAVETVLKTDDVDGP